MPDYLAVFQSGMLASVQNAFVAGELMQLNEITAEHGICLSKEDCADIAEFRGEALKENERVEVGLGAVKKIIETFSESRYVDQNNFRETVEALLECFYTVKTETGDRIGDDRVLAFIKRLYEDEAGGDVSKLYESEAFERFIYGDKSYGYRDDDGDSDADGEGWNGYR